MMETPLNVYMEIIEFALVIVRSYGAYGPHKNRLILFATILLIGLVMFVNGLIHSWMDFWSIVRLSSIYPLIAILLSRLYTLIFKNDRKVNENLQSIIIEFLTKNQKNPEYAKKLLSQMKFSYRIVRGFALLYGIVFHIPAISSWLIYFWKGEFILFIPAYLPFIDQHTIYGYLINSTLLALVSTLFFISIITSDIGYIIAPLLISLMIDARIYKLNNLADDYRNCEERVNQMVKDVIEKEASSSVSDKRKIINKIVLRESMMREYKQQLDNRFVDFIKDYEIYKDYIDKFSDLISFTFFVAVSVDSVAIGLSMLIAFGFSYPIGIALMIVFFFQIATPCIAGAIISHQNEKFLAEVCGFPWYEMSLEKQKIFLQFIQICQNASELVVPIFGDLNMELFTTVLNSSYSYLMYLLNFVKL